MGGAPLRPRSVRTAQSSSSLPPRFFCWRFEHAVGVSPSSLASIISIPSLSAFVAAGRSLVRSCRKLRRSDEPESCLSVWTQERRRCVYHFHLCVYSSQIESAVLCNNSFSLPAAQFTHSALAMHTRGMDWMKGHQSDRH